MTRHAAAPKVVLHDHLDGGVRPATLAELAAAARYDGFASHDPDHIAQLLHQGGVGDLTGYLAAFSHVTALLQDRDALHRVAVEAVTDLASDGVVYAELRFAPALHTRGGLSLDQVIEAVLAGLVDGEADAAHHGRRIHTAVILTAIREHPGSVEIADAAARWADAGVVGFDLAGNEAGHPATAHRAAFDAAHTAGLGVTIHAGESAGLASIADALQCRPHRLGHAVTLAADIDVDARDPRDLLGHVAQTVLAGGIHIEACPTSNVHTAAVPSLSAHPAAVFAALGFSVGINPDNRTMSAVAVSDELANTAQFGWGAAQHEAAQTAAMSAAFCDPELAGELLEEVIWPGWGTPPT